jgi:Tol biopolymer transport system component
MMLTRSVGGGGILAAAISVVALPYSFAAEEAKNEKIVFTRFSGEDKKISIVIMNADGSEQTKLTKGKEVAELDPALSPDGKRIAFVVLNLMGKEGEKADFYVMNADGSGRKLILKGKDNQFPFGPAWSPDGKKIAYSLTQAPKYDANSIMVMDADGKNSKRLADGLLPVWSRDGRKIIYSVMKKGKDFEPRLYVMDADGKNAKKLVDGKAMMGQYSPDGKRIVYMSAPPGEKTKPQVSVADADGKNAKEITKEEKDMDLAPRWSADGKRIYYSRMGEGKLGSGNLYVMDADGKNVKQLTKGKEGVDMLGGAVLFLMPRRVEASESGQPEKSGKE